MKHDKDRKKDRIYFNIKYRKIASEPIKMHIFLAQILIIITIVAIQTILQFYAIYMVEAPYTISAWLLGFSIAFWIDRNNEFINSIIIGGLFVILFAFGNNIANGVYLDFQHFPTLITGLYIIIKRKDIHVIYLIIGTFSCLLWFWTVYLSGIAYQYFSLSFIIALNVISIISVAFFYALLLSVKKQKNK